MSKKTVLSLRIILVILCLVWQGVIFGLSAEDSGGSAERSGGITEKIVCLITAGRDVTYAERTALAERIEAPLRTAAHMFCYFVLGCLYFLLATTFSPSLLKCAFISLTGVLLYAVTDEVHQYFVPGRSMQLSDIFADLFGAVIAVIVLWTVLRFIRKRRK